MSLTSTSQQVKESTVKLKLLHSSDGTGWPSPGMCGSMALINAVNCKIYPSMASSKFVEMGKRFRLCHHIALNLGMCWMGSPLSWFGSYPYQHMRYRIYQLLRVDVFMCFLHCARSLSIRDSSGPWVSSLGSSLGSVFAWFIGLLLKGVSSFMFDADCVVVEATIWFWGSVISTLDDFFVFMVARNGSWIFFDDSGNWHWIFDGLFFLLWAMCGSERGAVGLQSSDRQVSKFNDNRLRFFVCFSHREWSFLAMGTSSWRVSFSSIV